MKKAILIFALFFTFSIAHAQPEKWALGFKLGEPVGVVLRKYGDRNALDVSIGTYTGLLKSKKTYRAGEYSDIGFMINGTYLWYVPSSMKECWLMGEPGFRSTPAVIIPIQISRMYTPIIFQQGLLLRPVQNFSLLRNRHRFS